jgi:hypothetical protein
MNLDINKNQITLRHKGVQKKTINIINKERKDLTRFGYIADLLGFDVSCVF